MKKDALFTWLPSWRAGTPALSVTPTKPCEDVALPSARHGQLNGRSLLRLCKMYDNDITSSLSDTLSLQCCIGRVSQPATKQSVKAHRRSRLLQMAQMFEQMVVAHYNVDDREDDDGSVAPEVAVSDEGA